MLLFHDVIISVVVPAPTFTTPCHASTDFSGTLNGEMALMAFDHGQAPSSQFPCGFQFLVWTPEERTDIRSTSSGFQIQSICHMSTSC